MLKIIMVMNMKTKVILVVHKLAISIICIEKMEGRKLNQKMKMYIKFKLEKIRITYKLLKQGSWVKEIQKIIKLILSMKIMIKITVNKIIMQMKMIKLKGALTTRQQELVREVCSLHRQSKPNYRQTMTDMKIKIYVTNA